MHLRIGHLGKPDWRGNVKIGVDAPGFCTTAVIPVTGHPDASGIPNNAHSPIRIISKIEPHEGMTEQNDVNRAIDMVDHA